MRNYDSNITDVRPFKTVFDKADEFLNRKYGSYDNYCDCGGKLKDGEYQEDVVCDICGGKTCQHDTKDIDPLDDSLYEITVCSDCKEKIKNEL